MAKHYPATLGVIPQQEPEKKPRVSKRRKHKKMNRLRNTVGTEFQFETLEERIALSHNATDEVDLVAFAKALAAPVTINNETFTITFFGAGWCPHCTEQKELFEDGQTFLPFVEVTNPDRTINQTGIDNNITSYPTWVRFDNSGVEVERLVGGQTLAALAAFAGIDPIPESADPSVAPIDDVTLLAGAPLHLALDGYDPNGGPLTYTITTDDPNLQTFIPDGNESVRLSVAGYGDMVFELFQGRAPRPANRVADLARDGFYDGVTFHRILNGFVIQGGDPTGTGSGGSPLGDFDDQYHPDLQHTSTGDWSYAKTVDDTNDSQFFITEGTPRHLDFQHSIFGHLIEGESNRENISNTAANGSGQPNIPVTITTAEVFTDIENATLMLKADPGTVFSGPVLVTVTVTDEDGNSSQQQFNVTIVEDTNNNFAFMEDFVVPETTAGTPLSVDLTGIDLDSSTIAFAVVSNPESEISIDFNGTPNAFVVNDVDQSTTVTMNIDPGSFVGTTTITISLRDRDPVGNQTFDSVADNQTFTLTVAPDAPISIDLLDASDSGFSNTDDVTNLTSLDFLVSGVTDGATVTLFSGDDIIGTGVASGDSVTITANGSGNTVALIENLHNITATQTFASVESARSTILPVRIDLTPPAAMTSTAPTTAEVGVEYLYNADNDEEGDTGVLYSLSSGAPTGMSIDPNTGVVSWTPTADQVGLNSFTVEITDAAGNVQTQNVSVGVPPDAPVSVDLVAGSDTGASDSDDLTNITTLDFFIDGVLDGATVTLYSGNDIIGTGVASGTSVTITADGSGGAIALTEGIHAITATQSVEGVEGEHSNSLEVTIDQTDPAAMTSTAPIIGKVGLEYVYNAENDEEGDTGVLYSLLAGSPDGMTIDPATGEVTWTPNPQQFGQQMFTAQITDAAGNSTEQEVTVEVAEAVPTIDDDYNVGEDGLLIIDVNAGVLNNDGDALNGPLTVTLDTNVSNGTLFFNPDGSFSYTPNENFNGPDSFTYIANDDGQDSRITTVNITVDAEQDPPVAVEDNYDAIAGIEIAIDVANGVLANDTDADNEPLTAILEETTSNGTLLLDSDGSFTYTANPGFSGPDTFTYRASDGTDQTDPITVTINVNAPPVAVDDDYDINEDNTLTVVVGDGVLDNDTDAESDTLTATLVSGASNGTVTLNSNGSFTYIPNENFNGTDTFTYQARDVEGVSNTATVTITVNAINDPPVGVDDEYIYDSANSSLEIDAAAGVLENDSDVDGDDLSAVLVDDPAHGTVILNADGSFTYTPDATFGVTDSFTYRASDGDLQSELITVTILGNRPPVGVDDEYTTDEDTPLTVDVAEGVLQNDTDSDNDTLTANLVDDVSNGTLTLNADGSFNYTPDENFNGSDSFTYRANDGTEDSQLVTVTINVNSINDIPMGVDDEYNVEEDSTLSVNAASGILSNDTDIESSSLTADLVTDVSNGTLSLAADGSFTYTPNENFNGEDTFTYRASDGDDTSSETTVTITITPIDDPPVIVPIADQSATAGGELILPITASDVEGDDLLFDLVNPPPGAVIHAETGLFCFQVPLGSSGPTEITVRTTQQNSAGLSSTMTFTVNVSPISGLAATVLSEAATSSSSTGGEAAAALVVNFPDIDFDAEELPVMLPVSTPQGPSRSPFDLLSHGKSSGGPEEDKDGDKDPDAIDENMNNGDGASLDNANPTQEVFEAAKDPNDVALSEMDFSAGDVAFVKLTQWMLPKWAKTDDTVDRTGDQSPATENSRSQQFSETELTAVAEETSGVTADELIFSAWKNQETSDTQKTDSNQNLDWRLVPVAAAIGSAFLPRMVNDDQEKKKSLIRRLLKKMRS